MTIQQEVMAASQAWIAAFNRGELEVCANTYSAEATMQVYPHGQFAGRNSIAAFWQAFVDEAKPGDLQYRNVKIHAQGEDRAVLSATWSMNVGSGFISKELWQKEADGVWRLVEDDFSIVAVNEARAHDDALNTALLIVDLQNDYFEGGAMPLENTAAAANKAAELLIHFRQQQQTVVHIRHIFNDDSAGFFAPESNGNEIHSSVTPANGEPVVIKSAVNSFKDTELEDLLIAKGIKKLVITGAMSQMCIDAITRHASDAGYECTIIADACAAPTIEAAGVTGEQVHNTMMAALGFAYGAVMTAEEYLASV
ncbi:isochorismatase family protein [uncultured Pseudoteredinibacter sp.]|uniref:cysteine hydrolase family protein n=1 Tax=uncultured Pseudoteredinibacter sp. TaxID=1641701 RepID=UPI002611F602|nr:isochorismatase family protein [uncultured Pseudoteredinibacter sp.]